MARVGFEQRLRQSQPQRSKPVVLKLFAPAAHFATFPNFAAHLDQSADFFWSALSFPRFPLPDAL